MLGLLVVIGLALVLMWQVYRHHGRVGNTDEDVTAIALGITS